jgi:hypothetical protein
MRDRGDRSADPQHVGENIAHMLTRYEGRSDRTIIRRTEQLLRAPAVQLEVAMIEAILPDISKALDEKA